MIEKKNSNKKIEKQTIFSSPNILTREFFDLILFLMLLLFFPDDDHDDDEDDDDVDIDNVTGILSNDFVLSLICPLFCACEG